MGSFLLYTIVVAGHWLLASAALNNGQDTRIRLRMENDANWTQTSNRVFSQSQGWSRPLSRHRRDEWSGWDTDSSEWMEWATIEHHSPRTQVFVLPIIMFMLFVGLIIFIICARRRGWFCFRRPVYSGVNQNTMVMIPPAPQAYPAGPYYGPPQGPVYAPVQGYPPQGQPLQAYPPNVAADYPRQPQSQQLPPPPTQNQYPAPNPNMYQPPPGGQYQYPASPPAGSHYMGQPEQCPPYPTGAPAPAQPFPNQPPPSYETVVPNTQAPAQSSGVVPSGQQPSYNPEFSSAGDTATAPERL